MVPAPSGLAELLVGLSCLSGRTLLMAAAAEGGAGPAAAGGLVGMGGRKEAAVDLETGEWFIQQIL